MPNQVLCRLMAFLIQHMIIEITLILKVRSHRALSLVATLTLESVQNPLTLQLTL